jgi:hypothetical protein
LIFSRDLYVSTIKKIPFLHPTSYNQSLIININDTTTNVHINVFLDNMESLTSLTKMAYLPYKRFACDIFNRLVGNEQFKGLIFNENRRASLKDPLEVSIRIYIKLQVEFYYDSNWDEN